MKRHLQHLRRAPPPPLPALVWAQGFPTACGFVAGRDDPIPMDPRPGVGAVHPKSVTTSEPSRNRRLSRTRRAPQPQNVLHSGRVELNLSIVTLDPGLSSERSSSPSATEKAKPALMAYRCASTRSPPLPLVAP